jgi:nuclear pore complex protein Nup53
LHSTTSEVLTLVLLHADTPGDASGASPPPPLARTPTAAAAAAAPGTGYLDLTPASKVQDPWVTVYGFTVDELALVLREFQKCGDIAQWGTFGAPSKANFIHIQYQSPHAAQRALLRSGEQLSSDLFIGVRPLDALHKQKIEAFTSSSGGSPAPRVSLPSQPARPYKVDLASVPAMPQPSRTLVEKLSHFVLGF